MFQMRGAGERHDEVYRDTVRSDAGTRNDADETFWRAD